MGHKKIIRQELFPYHVTARSNNQDWFNVPLDKIWQIFKSELRKLQKKERIQIHAFVLMSNHFHLMISTPNSNIDRVMYFLMKHVTLEIQKVSGRVNKIFGGRYKWSMVTTDRYYLNCYRYIYQNPIRAGIVSRVDDYRYSFIFEEIRKSANRLTIFRYCKELNFESELSWLNRVYPVDTCHIIKIALKKSEYSYSKRHESVMLTQF